MQNDVPAFDAIILAGGRSSRLGGVPKQGLLFRGTTLLNRSIAAVEGARATVIVGPDPGPLPPGVLTCREEPEFAGPAAAIATGLDVLGRAGAGAPHTLVLACDMPLVSGAVRALLDELSTGKRSGSYMACTEDEHGAGRMQPLAGLYSTGMLKKSALEMATNGRLVNGSVRSLLASLDVQLVAVPATYTADVDTWDDAAALGIAAGSPDVEDGAGRGRS